jgi:hypothetical protein
LRVRKPRRRPQSKYIQSLTESQLGIKDKGFEN